MTLNDLPDFQIDKKAPIWANVEDKSKEEPYSKWNMTTLSRDSCKTPKNKLPKTDSRLRPDRIALEKQQYTEAASEKHRLEEAQRHKKKIRDQNNMEWTPKYFTEDKNATEFNRWIFKNNYWGNSVEVTNTTKI